MTNTSSNSTDANFGIGLPYPEPIRIILIFLGIVYTTVGVPGNALVIYVILKLKNLRVRLNMFVLNLMLADIISVGYIVPFTVADLLSGKYPGDQNICSFNALVTPTVCFTSLFSIMFIAANRYIKMRNDLLYEKIFSQKKTVMMCVLPWTIGPLCSLYYIENPSSLIYSVTAHICFPNESMSPRIVLIGILIPFIFVSTTIFYIKLMKKLRDHDISLRNHGNEAFLRIRHTVNQRFIFSNFIVFLLFILLYLPIFSTHLSIVTVSAPFHGFALSLCFANSAFNWIVYGIMNSTLRKSYKHLMPSIRRIQVTPVNGHGLEMQ